MLKRLSCLLALLHLLVMPAYAANGAQTPPDSLKLLDENDQAQSWNLTADTLVSLDDGAVVEAQGDVFVQHGLDYLKADFARYFPSTNWVYLRGNVDVRLGKDVIRANEAEFDLRSRTGWLIDGDIFMEGPHMYFRGGRIVKHRGDRYSFHQARITACDGDVPAWSVLADEAMLEIDGYALLYGSALQVADTTVLASPFMVVPAKTTRQSGLLVPDYGYSSLRGLFYTQPYFHVLDDSRDLTLYATMMSKAGLMASARYRSHTAPRDKLWFMGSALAGRDVVRSPGDDPTDMGLARTNWNRYWLRGMADGYVGETPWRYRVNMDLVSDQGYLREFSSGPIGFDDSRDEAFAMFGRNLREDDQKRLNTATVYRDWDRAGLAVGIRYEQDARLGHGNVPARRDETAQTLPFAQAFLFKGRAMPDMPLEIEMRADTEYLYRRTGTSGGKSELYPRLTLPLDMRYASLLGTVGWRQTFYHTTSQAHSDPVLGGEVSALPNQSGTSRSLLDMDLQLYTDLERAWWFTPDASLQPQEENLGNSRTTGLYHQIQPRLRYRLTPTLNQNSNPYYSPDDRILARDELTYSLTNILSRQVSAVTRNPGEEGEPPVYAVTDSHADVLRWQVQAGYDRKEASRTRYREEFSRRPFTDVYSELELWPFDWLSYTSRLYISPYDLELSRYDHTFTLSPWNWLHWSTGTSYRTGEYELRQKLKMDDEIQIQRESPLHLLDNHISLSYDAWGIEYVEYRDIKKNEIYDQRLNLTYTEQCYRFIFSMRANETERSFGLYVELPGLFE
jgi:LPS-assembly protein